MTRIHAAPHPDAGTANEEALGAEIRVTFDSGEVIGMKVGAALGRGPDNPMPAAVLAAKFVNCASRALPAASVVQLQQMLDSLETVSSIKSVTAAIEVPRKLAAE
jgi:hypothetical protein